MKLKNSDVTKIIETLTSDFREMLTTINKTSQRLHGYNIEPTAVIDQLLNTSDPQEPITIEQLNSNYQTIMGLPRHELLIEKTTDQDANQLIMQAAKIHLTAIAAGFVAYARKQEQEQAQQRAKAGRTRQAQPNVVQHIHYHRGYRRDFFMDYLWYQTIFGRNRYSSTPYYPEAPTTKKKKSDDEVSTAGLILGAVLVGAATATLGYSVMQTYYRIDEIIHNEDKMANIAKLTVTGFAAWQGFLVGTLIGATYFANPLLGAICTSIIASAAGMKLSKWGAQLVHSTNKDSALASDPRFCLTSSQAASLKSKGFDADVVQESLREIAIMIKTESTNGLKFWHNPHGPLITLMRELKSGYKNERLVLNGKTFELMAPNYNISQEFSEAHPPQYQYQYQYPDIDCEHGHSAQVNNNEPSAPPPVYDYYYQPQADAPPQYNAGYPEWQEQAEVPDDYKSIYPNISNASAPPM